MSGYKLYYFPVRARAEICRLSFAAAKIDFEDIRLDGEEWAKEKACEYNYKQGGKRLGDETSVPEQKGVMQWTGIELGARPKFKIQRSKLKILIIY